MSAIPAFEIGVWNAWIFMAYLLLLMIYFIYIAIKKDVPSVEESGLSRVAKILASSSKLLLFPVLVYSIFLPMKLGTTWFYAGLPITLLGLINITIVMINWAITPPNTPITRGLYHYSRNPMYVTMFIFLLGLGIVTASWVLLLLFIVFVVGCVVFVNVEEQSCLKKYGDAYREYMNRTPRWIGIPKS